MSRLSRAGRFASGVGVLGFMACGIGQGLPSTSDPGLKVSATQESGAVLVRGSTLTFLVHLDRTEGLLSVHAPVDLCSGGGFNTADFQFVSTPGAVAQFIARLRDDDAQVAIYRAASFAEAGLSGAQDVAGIGGIIDVAAFCAFLTSDRLLAAGVVRRTSVLSNASFTATWAGNVQAADGRRMRLTERYQLGADARDPGDMTQWVVHVSFVRVGTSP